MSRQSTNQVNEQGLIQNGYSYRYRCWIRDYTVERCGHPEAMDCGCYGRQHAGERIAVGE